MVRWDGAAGLWARGAVELSRCEGRWVGGEDRAAPGSPRPPWSLPLASGAQPVHGGLALAQHTGGTQILAGVVLGSRSWAQPGGSKHPCQEGLVLPEPPGETHGSASSLPDPHLPQNLLGNVLKARPLVWGVCFGPLWVMSQACLQAPSTPHCLPGVPREAAGDAAEWKQVQPVDAVGPPALSLSRDGWVPSGQTWPATVSGMALGHVVHGGVWAAGGP